MQQVPASPIGPHHPSSSSSDSDFPKPPPTSHVGQHTFQLDTSRGDYEKWVNSYRKHPSDGSLAKAMTPIRTIETIPTPNNDPTTPPADSVAKADSPHSSSEAAKAPIKTTSSSPEMPPAEAKKMNINELIAKFGGRKMGFVERRVAKIEESLRQKAPPPPSST